MAALLKTKHERRSNLPIVLMQLNGDPDDTYTISSTEFVGSRVSSRKDAPMWV
jgi:hypothetical protein